jgi:hypothetical protein
LIEKSDKLSHDILEVLKNHEPQRLRNHEICDSLFNSYKYHYKDEKTFGVAVSQKLPLLKTKKLIIHEGVWYGTINSKPIMEQPSKNEEITEEIIEQIDIRPEFCGVKASPKFCEEHGLPQFREVKHVIRRKAR